MTEGLKSSEFIKSIMAFLAGLAMIWFGSKSGNKELIEYGTIIVTGSTVGYGLSRGLAKLGNSHSTAAQPVLPPLTPEEAAKVIGTVK